MKKRKKKKRKKYEDTSSPYKEIGLEHNEVHRFIVRGCIYNEDERKEFHKKERKL